MNVRVLAVLCACLATLWCCHAAARPDEPAHLFQQAKRAYGRGDYRGAAQLFEQAYAIDAHGATAYNAALAWREAGEPARAADACALAVGRGDMNAEEQAVAEAELRALEAEVATLHLQGPEGATASVAHAERARLPATVHAPPGTLTIRFERGDIVEERRVEAQAGRVYEIDWAPREAPAPSVPEVAVAAPEETPALLIAGYGAAGLALAGVAVAIGVGVAALDARDAWEASNLTALDEYQRADDLRLASNVTLGVSLAMAATGGVMLFLGYTEPW